MASEKVAKFHVAVLSKFITLSLALELAVFVVMIQVIFFSFKTFDYTYIKLI